MTGEKTLNRCRRAMQFLRNRDRVRFTYKTQRLIYSAHTYASCIIIVRRKIRSIESSFVRHKHRDSVQRTSYVYIVFCCCWFYSCLDSLSFLYSFIPNSLSSMVFFSKWRATDNERYVDMGY